MRNPFFVFLALSAFYMLPGLIAIFRRRPDQWLILLSNVLFGWTILGWIGALTWACRTPDRAAAGRRASVAKSKAAERVSPLSPLPERRRRASAGRTAYQWDDLEGRDQYAAWLEQNNVGARRGVTAR